MLALSVAFDTIEHPTNTGGKLLELRKRDE